MEYPISLDTALSLVNGMFVMKTNLHQKSTNSEEKDLLMQEIKTLSKERKLLYGNNEFARLSVMEKTIKIYSPILKKEYADEK